MNTKYIYLLIAFSAFCQTSFGQIDLLKDGSLPYDTSTTAVVELAGERTDNSNSLNRNLLEKLVFGGYINSAVKESVTERLDGRNYYRGMMNPALNFTLFPDSARFGYLFSYRYTNIADLRFSNDFFKLAFYGNASFGDQLANLSGSGYLQQTYQSLSFGLVEKKSGSFLSIGLYDGIDFRNYSFGQTYFLTEYGNTQGETYAENMYFNTSNSEFLESSNSYKPFGNGVGVGLSARYNFEASDHKISVSVTDLGAIYWRDIASRDTTGEFEFSGFEFSPRDGSTVDDVVESLVDSIIPNGKNINKWVLLPGFVQVNYVSPAKNRIFTSARAIHYYGTDYYTEVSADLNMKYGKSNFLWLTAGFGGFDTYLLGLGTEFSVFQDGVFRIGSRQVLGFVDGSVPTMNLYFQYIQRL